MPHRSSSPAKAGDPVLRELSNLARDRAYWVPRFRGARRVGDRGRRYYPHSLTHLISASRPAGQPHRRPEHRGRPRGCMVPAVHGARRVRAGADALRARHRLDLAAGVGDLRPRRAVHVGGGLDARRRRPRARRHLLCRRDAAPQGRGRSARRAVAVAAVHADLARPLLVLRRPRVDDPGRLTRDERHTGGVPAQDADPAVRGAARAARPRPGAACRARARRRGRRARALKMPMGLSELIAVVMVVAVCGLLLAGYPVALTLAGVSLAFAALGHLAGVMSIGLLGALPVRIFGVMTNEVLLAIPLFIFMGVMLERSHIAEELLETMGRLFGAWHGGLGVSVAIVGALLAAAKGVVGATTVTMGLITLPTMLRYGYDPRLAAGSVAATATLAQIFPPATVLVLLGDQIGNAYQAAQLAQGNFAPSSVTVSDLFAGAIVPGFALVAMYILYLIAMAIFFPK